MPKYAKPPTFHYLWRDELSLESEVPLDHDKAQVFRAFAEKVYNRLVNHHIDELLTERYNDGYEDGQEEACSRLDGEIAIRDMRTDQNTMTFEEIRGVISEFSKNLSR